MKESARLRVIVLGKAFYVVVPPAVGLLDHLDREECRCLHRVLVEDREIHLVDFGVLEVVIVNLVVDVYHSRDHLCHLFLFLDPSRRVLVVVCCLYPDLAVFHAPCGAGRLRRLFQLQSVRRC